MSKQRHLHVRASEQEIEEWTAAAESEGLRLSQWVRRQLTLASAPIRNALARGGRRK